MKICKICGSQLEDYASFCTNCGSLVENEQPQQYTQPEAVAEENLETVEEISAFDAATLYVKKIKTAFITSIVSTSLTPFFGLAWIFFAILSVIPIVNIISSVVWLFLGTALIVSALVCGIIALLNTSKVNKLAPVYEGSVDEELFNAYQSAQKKSKVAKILGIIGTVLAALVIALWLLWVAFVTFVLVIYVLFLLFGIGGSFINELMYMF